MRTPGQLRLALAAAALALVPTGAAEAAIEATAQTVRETTVLTEVNRTRVARGLPPLRVDGALARAARRHAATLLRSDALYHGAFRARLVAAGARGPAYGENLAWGVGTLASARSIVRGWLASPGHRANLLRPGFRRIGVGTRVGEFAGHGDATVVAAAFAGR